jgi:hypothetical protein
LRNFIKLNLRCIILNKFENFNVNENVKFNVSPLNSFCQKGRNNHYIIFLFSEFREKICTAVATINKFKIYCLHFMSTDTYATSARPVLWITLRWRSERSTTTKKV